MNLEANQMIIKGNFNIQFKLIDINKKFVNIEMTIHGMGDNPESITIHRVKIGQVINGTQSIAMVMPEGMEVA